MASSHAPPASPAPTIDSSTTTTTTLPPPTPTNNDTLVYYMKTVELTGVEVAIIIAVGLSVFVILTMLALRQVRRIMFGRQLLSLSAGAPRIATLHGIDRNACIRVHEQMRSSGRVEHFVDTWNEQHSTTTQKYRTSDERPRHYWRARAIDQCNRLLPVLYSFGGKHFLWAPFENVDEFFKRKRREFPYSKIRPEGVEALGEIYQRLRYDEGVFDDVYFHRMRRLVDDIVEDLLQAREELDEMHRASRPQKQQQPLASRAARILRRPIAQTSSAPAAQAVAESSGTESGRTLLLPRDSERLAAPRIAPLGYERLDQDASYREVPSGARGGGGARQAASYYFNLLRESMLGRHRRVLVSSRSTIPDDADEMALDDLRSPGSGSGSSSVRLRTGGSGAAARFRVDTASASTSARSRVVATTDDSLDDDDDDDDYAERDLLT